MGRRRRRGGVKEEEEEGKMRNRSEEERRKKEEAEVRKVTSMALRVLIKGQIRPTPTGVAKLLEVKQLLLSVSQSHTTSLISFIFDPK